MMGSSNCGLVLGAAAETFLSTEFESDGLGVNGVHTTVENPHFHAIDVVTSEDTILDIMAVKPSRIGFW
jgi:hypothetical protein